MNITHVLYECNSYFRRKTVNIEIKRFRERTQISQQGLAIMLQVDQSTVAKWESKKAAPRADLLPKIADVLGCTIDELFGRTISQKSNSTEN